MTTFSVMDAKENSSSSRPTLNAKVFFPPVIFLIGTVAYSIVDQKAFLEKMQVANQWILEYFGSVFTLGSFLFLVILMAVYFSPFGKIKIGGEKAVPILSRWRWFAIALCTTIATGILFWGSAEPLYHLHAPPDGAGVKADSVEAAHFAISTLFMHWSFTPYGIYTMAGLVFALAYYNLRQPFSISALIYPIVGKKAHGGVGDVLNIICLYGLAAGMAASLGTGIFALMGGLEENFGMTQSSGLMGVIGVAIVFTFILSAASGLKKGIRVFSDWNTKAFFVLAFLVFVLGPWKEILGIGWGGAVDYVVNFLPRSTNIGSELDNSWQNAWTIFYLSNWFAWAPVAALFLGRLSVGYSVRDFIHFNLVFPSLFACVWMTIFGGSAIQLDFLQDGSLYEMLKTEGEENIMYTVLEQLPGGAWISMLTVVVVFISYVTAADSNISAMGAICSRGIRPENPEAPLWIKIAWGILIGLMAWLMITLAGIDGIRLLCVLGGFPALFIIIVAGLGILKMWLTKTDLNPPIKK